MNLDFINSKLLPLGCAQVFPQMILIRFFFCPLDDSKSRFDEDLVKFLDSNGIKLFYYKKPHTKHFLQSFLFNFNFRHWMVESFTNSKKKKHLMIEKKPEGCVIYVEG